jgi:hypothetical protein
MRRAGRFVGGEVPRVSIEIRPRRENHIQEITFEVKVDDGRTITENCTYSYPLRYASYRMRYGPIDCARHVMYS